MPITRSTSCSRPKCSAVPRPLLPRIPVAWASSSIMRALYFRASRTISGRLAMSPSMLKTPSTTMSLPLFPDRANTLSRSAMSLWRKRRVCPKESRQPSTMLAWSHRSAMRTSPLPPSAERIPRFVWKPVEKRRAASRPLNLASFHSSSSCRSCVPFRKREPPHPVPYRSRASRAASFTFGWVLRPR